MSDIIIIALRNGGESVVDVIDAELGSLKWYRLPHGYATGSLSRRHPTHPNKKIYLHRVVMARSIGRELKRGENVDHIDGDRLNNIRANLRIADKSQNQCNRPASRDCKSGFKGVSESGSLKNPWAARIRARVDGVSKDINLKLFPTAEDAARAYDRAAVQYHKEFACLNFPDEWERDSIAGWRLKDS